MTFEQSLCRWWILTVVCLIVGFTCEEITAEERREGCKIIETKESFMRTAKSTYDVRLWPSHRIPYQLGSNLRQQDKEVFYRALEDFHNHTCLRFEPRWGNEGAYIDVFMNHGHWGICGAANLCYQGKRQEVEIWHKCSDVGTFVHELGHALCMQHEQERVDRDLYLDLSQCNNPSSIAPKIDCLTTRGHLYDYNSQSHYWCNKCVGLPKMDGVTECGYTVNKVGLSVMDADKLNTYYNCGGCHRHRWYRVETLTATQKSYLVNFAPSGEAPIYLCRGYVKGEVATGMYSETERVCQIPHRRDIYKLQYYIQLFGLPNGPYSLTNSSTTGYRLFDPLDYSQAHHFLSVGRMKDNTIYLAAVAKVMEEDGRVLTLLGKVDKTFRQIAHFPRGGKGFTMGARNAHGYYHVIGCTTS